MKTRKTHLIFACPDQMIYDIPVWTEDWLLGSWGVSLSGGKKGSDSGNIKVGKNQISYMI
jgi:hypothetical protein